MEKDFRFKEAARFLAALRQGSDSKFVFQTFGDKKEDRANKALIKIKHGEFSKNKEYLERLNELGAGIFVTVNESDGKRRKKDIAYVNAVFIDKDDGEEYDEKKFILPPNIVVKTKNGYHAYWVISPSKEFETWKQVQQRLAEKFGADEKIKDLPRVMRLPGFYHNKSEKFLVRIISIDNSRKYTLENIINAFDIKISDKKVNYSKHKTKIDISEISIERRLLVARKYADKIEAASEGDRHATLFRFVAVGHDFGIPPEIWFDEVAKWNERCSPPFSDSELGYQYNSMLNSFENEFGNKLDLSSADIIIPKNVPWGDFSDSYCKVKLYDDDDDVEPPEDLEAGWSKDEWGPGVSDEPLSDEGFDVFSNSSSDGEFYYDDRRHGRKTKKRIGMPVAKLLGIWEPSFDTNGIGRTPPQIADWLMNEYEVLHTDANIWYIYDGKKWVTIVKETVAKAALQYFAADEFKVDALNQVLRIVESRRHVKQIEWNRILICEVPFNDGVLNLKTGEIRPHRAQDMLDRVIPCSYNPNAKCDLWLKCLQQWLPDKKQEQIALQYFFGYLLMPSAKYKKALLLFGEPDTGKSQVCAVAREVVGGIKYVCGILPGEMNNPRARAPIKGKALNLITDLPKNELIDDGGFKQLVSTGEPVTLDQKNVAQEQYIPSAKHIFATNNLPSVSDQTMGIYRRLLIINFQNVIPLSMQDPDIEYKIMKELPGIIAWAVEGAKKLYKSGGKWPTVKSSEEILEEYKQDMNPIHAFIEESGVIIKDPAAKIRIETFTKAFNAWRGPGVKAWGAVGVGRALATLGYHRAKIDGVRAILGVRLASPTEAQTHLHLIT